MREDFNIGSILIAGVAAAVIWANTDSIALTVFATIVILMIASASIFRSLVQFGIAAVRELGRVAVTYIRARNEMYKEYMRTERERFKWESRIGVERARQESHLLRQQQRLAAGRLRTETKSIAVQPAAGELFSDSDIDVEYSLVDTE